MSAKKIIRRPDRVEGGVTDAERLALAEHAQLWIARAFRTAPIEPDKIEPAIRGLYAAANRRAPRVVVVPSPLVMAIAGTIAAEWWRIRDSAVDSAVRSATASATASAVRSATASAVRSAVASAVDSDVRSAVDSDVYSAVDSATASAVYSAVDSATASAVDSATASAVASAVDSDVYSAVDSDVYSDVYSATASAVDSDVDSAVDSAVYSATASATGIEKDLSWITDVARKFLGSENSAGAIRKMSKWRELFQGGNAWAGWDAYLTAFRDVFGLRLPQYEKYAHWEQAAIHGGFRYMQPEFCMVCDFPERILIDDRNLSHCEDGPSHRWRDGWSLYHLHGVVVPRHVIERPETITLDEIKSEENAEVRRIMIERYGWPRYLAATGAKVLHVRRNDVDLTDEALMQDGDGGRHLICACPSTARVYAMRVPREIESCEQAQKWLAGDKLLNVIVSS